ncbi:MAG TPA: acetolactate decarboxylase, partial [Thermoanaerobaculia bacterium]|nr:acetolactate decarboxylase [Thermoanaerobaculia bacterium]
MRSQSRRIALGAVLVLAVATVAGAQPLKRKPVPATSLSVWQNQPFIALGNGHFQGSATVQEAKRHGNLGIGALAAIDGEVMVLDGVLYQFHASGGVRRPPGAAEMSFAMMARFVPEERIEVPHGTRLKDLPALLAKLSPNYYFALRIDGKFSCVRARTFVAQREPYRPICQADPPPQGFSFTQVEGTMVGFKSPVFAANVSGPPVHLHFLRGDKTGGGHVLDLVVDHATLTLDRLSGLALDLPKDAAFAGMDLSQPAECPSPPPPPVECPPDQP